MSRRFPLSAQLLLSGNFELQLVELPKLRLDNREIIEARLTSPVELQNTIPTVLVAAYLARRQSLGWHPDPT